ncbi:hypothetical protein E2C01_051070 [Portunus trituberculatus]|uniref:Uncharacterized protein n=1 Tax=Portunus trituberculatus TaxID=210409 RepID=A0A5B7GKT1_PORTR|nr:hypothetical protein [Portunus trituberculatus]
MVCVSLPEHVFPRSRLSAVMQPPDSPHRTFRVGGVICCWMLVVLLSGSPVGCLLRLRQSAPLSSQQMAWSMSSLREQAPHMDILFM